MFNHLNTIHRNKYVYNKQCRLTILLRISLIHGYTNDNDVRNDACYNLLNVVTIRIDSFFPRQCHAPRRKVNNGCSQHPNFSGHKIFHDQKIFGPRLFQDLHFIGTEIFQGPNFFRTLIFFGTQNFLDPKCFVVHNFWITKCLVPNTFWYTKFFISKFFRDPNILGP